MPAPMPAPVLSSNLFQEAIMPDMETGKLKKTIERKKHL